MTNLINNISYICCVVGDVISICGEHVIVVPADEVELPIQTASFDWLGFRYGAAGFKIACMAYFAP